MFFSFDVLSAAQGHLRTKNKFKTLFWWPLLVVVEAFPSLARNLGEAWTIHSPPAFFNIFLSGDQLARSSAIFLRLESVRSGSASLADRGRVFPDELRVNSFP